MVTIPCNNSTTQYWLHQVFTPVMERARRVSKTISKPFMEDWSSDEEDQEEDTDPFSLFSVRNYFSTILSLLGKILLFLQRHWQDSSFLCANIDQQ